MSTKQKLYFRYEYLAEKYSGKIFNLDKYGLERDDITQELKIKIWTAINTYGKTWREYKRTGRYKPIRLELYIKATLNNKIKDIVKKMQREQEITTHKISMSEIDFDYGTENNNHIEVEKNKFTLQGVDLCLGLKGRNKMIFIMWLKGHTMKKLSEKFGCDASVIINTQRELMKAKLHNKAPKMYVSYSLES